MNTRQFDLFRLPFHAIFVSTSGQKATVLSFADKTEMRKVVLAKMRLDRGTIAYAELCSWTGLKVQTLERIYHGDREI